MNEVAQAMLLLSAVAIIGLGFGNIRIKGVSLGVGGVLFGGILAGHFTQRLGIHINPELMNFIKEFGLILFVYTIGIQVGPSFFEALKKAGLKLNALAASIVILGALLAALIHVFGSISLPAVLGIFSGAVTNTPSLAAGQEVLREVGASVEDLAMPGLGYAVAYPFGIVGILLSMWLIRILLRIGIEEEVEAFERQQQTEGRGLKSLNVTIRNVNLDGVALSQIPGLKELDVVCSRMMRDGELRIPNAETPLALGDIVHLVGLEKALHEMQVIMGETSDVQLTTKGTELRVDRIVVTNNKVLGKTIGELALHKLYGVVISRVNRAGVELLPRPGLSLQFGDILNIIGPPDAIATAGQVVGNVRQKLQQVQMIPIFIGIGLGVLVGSLPLYLPEMPAALKLGLAGGPLLVALVLSRVANIGPVYWFMPPSANLALRELGIVLFLAVVGLKSGEHFVETIVRGQGALWVFYGAVITLVPLLVVGFFARQMMKLNYLTTCGLLAGSMTDPPALAFANALSTSEAPALAYATVYPLVMCLRILVPQVLVLAFWVSGGA